MKIKSSATGGVWLVAMIIYFILFIGIGSTANLVGEEDISSYESDLSIATAAGGICGERMTVDPSESLNDRSIVTFGNLSYAQRFSLNFYYSAYESNLDCEYNFGELGEDYCTFEGCSWNNATEDCEGQMNSSYYGIESDDAGLFVTTEKVANHDNTGFFEVATPCNHPDVLYNQTLCTLFTCEWYTEGTTEYIETSEESDNLGDTYDQIKPIFTYNITEYFNTGSTVLDWVLNFIFIILPAIILIASLWFTFAPTK